MLNDFQARPEVNPQLAVTRNLALFLCAVSILLWAMYLRLGSDLADDGAFFLRYAQNMLEGEFWIWNPEGAPVWGASAPLYPVILTIPIYLGVPPDIAIVAVGLALSSISISATSLMLGRKFGTVSGLAFLSFAAFDSYLMSYSGSGLETPLTITILTISLWALLYRPKSWLVGVVAGVLMVNKIDLIPVGGLLLLARSLQEKRIPVIAIINSAMVSFAWYGFAWWYFGAPVPNSFLTKFLHQNNQPKSIDWTWFGNLVLWSGFHKWLVGLSVFTVKAKDRDLRPLTMFFGGTLAVHLIAYTIDFPFEPYNWYAMPSIFSLMVLGSIGIGILSSFIARAISGTRWPPIFVAMAILLAIFVTGIGHEISVTKYLKIFSSHQEYDRTEADRWVAKNTPKNYVVYTMWGNPAYYSHRKVIDGSFLNRKFERGDLIKKYKPQILILQNNPGGNPMSPSFPPAIMKRYTVVKVFDKTYEAGMDYFFVVLARNDVLARIHNIDTPIDLMQFIHGVVPGDKYGLLKPISVDTIFIQPGEKTPTTFQFDASRYVESKNTSSLKIVGRIAPNVPRDALRHGGGTAHLSIFRGKDKIVDKIVRLDEPFEINLPIAAREVLRFSADNRGTADSNWLWLSFH